MEIVEMRKRNWGKVIAMFDVESSEGFLMGGFKLINGKSGKFVSFPSCAINGKKYFKTIYATKEAADKLLDLAIEAYKEV